MAWQGSPNNRSLEGSKNAPVRKGVRHHGIVVKSVVTVFAIASCILIALWFFPSSDNDAKSDEPKKPKKSQIKTVVPVKVTNSVTVAKKENPKAKHWPISPDARPSKVGEVVNGYVKLPSGRLHRQLGVYTNSTANRPRGKYEIFTRECNNDIAGCLSMKPGDPVIGIPPYNGRFKKDFIESLEEPIIISEDDTPEQAQLKRDVIAARIELKDAMDRGEDIEKIMLDERRELQKLMHLKQEYKNLFVSELKNCQTDKDVEDLFNACNQMLESRGIAPLKYGPITKRNILRDRQNQSGMNQ